MAGYQVFKESDVRKSILKKAIPRENIKKGKKHWSGIIKVDGYLLGSMGQIPNDHSKEFWKNKAKSVADDLMLNADEYNEFVSCRMTAKEYQALLREKFPLPKEP